MIMRQTALALTIIIDTGNLVSETNAQRVSVSRIRHTETHAFTAVDFARHVKQLRQDMRKELGRAERKHLRDFTIIIQPPFVVIGDEPAAAVREHATSTVKWAVDRLKQDFFSDDPLAILDIWLFKDAASYQKYARIFFGDTPSTPYGYYSSAHKALIMNIETGGGTLVHEIVHPFMEANFPACSPWFNEGLGSLYEQCGDDNGHIHGYTNWRLPGLQRAIRSNQVPTFQELTSFDSNRFYNEDRGTNYAQARYLCYYLQQKGKLVTFYREFLVHRGEDATGFETLKRVLGEPNMDDFKTRWEKFVLDLRQGYEVTIQ
jgi:hypothetical protein